MHTPEPWMLYASGEIYGNISGEKRVPVYERDRSGAWINDEGENIPRIIACVNALAGVKDPAALREALEELRSAWPGTSNVLHAVGKIIALLPAPETDGK